MDAGRPVVLRGVVPGAGPGAPVRVERRVVTARRAGRRLVVRVRSAPRGVRVRLARLDLDTYRCAPVAARRLSAGHARFTLGAPGVYRAEVDARGGLSAGASRPIEFRPGAFRQ